jgi:hypothetical protein
MSAGWFADPSARHELRYWNGNEWTAHVADGGAQGIDPIEPVSAQVRSAETDHGQMPRLRPETRLIRSPRDAEEAAAEWMRYWGFADAEATQRSADGGVDVRASRAVAQVKAHQVPIGRPDLQRLHGMAVTEGKMSLFFSLMHFTPQALEWADSIGMALFRFNYACEPEPVNAAAQVIVDDAPEYEREDARPPEPAVAHVVTDANAVLALQRVRGGGLAGKEALVDIRAAWLLVFLYRLETDQREGVRRIARHHTTYVALDSFIASPVDPRLRNASQVTAASGCLVGPLTAEKTAQRLYAVWRSARRQTRAVDKVRSSSELRRFGIPSNAETMTVDDDGSLRYPVFVGCLERRSGRRLAVVDALTSVVRADWSEALTRYLPHVGPELSTARQVVGRT